MARNIVALVDLEDQGSCRAVLATAIDHAGHRAARLHVLNVVPDGHYKMSIVTQLIPADYERRLVDDARRRLADLLKEQATGGLQVEQAVRLGSVYKEALDYARDVDAELIVMGAHRPEAMDFLVGPNTEQIVRHARCSVLVVRG